MAKYLKRDGYSLYYFNRFDIVTTEKIKFPKQKFNDRIELFAEEWATELKVEVRYVEYALRKLGKGSSYEDFLDLIKAGKAFYEKKDYIEAQRKAFDERLEAKTLEVAELVGNCRFDIISVVIDGKAIPEKIETDFLVYDYSFEDVEKIQNEIFVEVVRRLKESKKFKRYCVPVGCYSAKMSFGINPNSIRVIFTLKKELFQIA